MTTRFSRRRVATGFAVYFAGYCLWLVAGWGGPSTVGVVRTVGALTISVWALCCAVAAARRLSGRSRLLWIVIMLGLGGWVFGDSTWVVYTAFLGVAPPVIHIGHAGYLTMSLFACVALVLLPAADSTRLGLHALLDGLIVFASLFIVAWVGVLQDLTHTVHGGPLRLLVMFAYPLFDVAIMTLAISALAQTRTPRRGPLGLLIVGLMFIALSNSFLLFLSKRTTLDIRFMAIGWMAGIVLIGMAAIFWEGPARRHNTRVIAMTSPLSLLIPYLPLPVAMTVAFVFFRDVQGAVPLLVACGALISTVLARQFLTLTQNARLLREASERALHDPLTGLANRTNFRTELEHALLDRAAHGRDVAVLLLDLDGFKQVNDNLGHSVGDTVLEWTAERLLAHTSDGDVVARLGGDEFAVLLDTAHRSPRQSADAIRHAFDEPFVVGNDIIAVRPSIGIAVADSSDLVGAAAASELLHRADTAMYEAKRSRLTGLEDVGAG